MVAANIIRAIEDKALQMRELIVTDLIGDKIDSAARVKSLEKRMLEAAASRSEEAVAA